MSILDKTQPCDVEAERATLGSILLNRDAIVAVDGWLLPEFFYLERHAWIYEAMQACYRRRVPPDTSTVSDELRRRERLEQVGGLLYLIELANAVPTAVHIEYYGRVVERTAILRRLINAGGKIAAMGFDEREELEITLDKAEAELFAVSQKRANQDFIHIGQVVDAYFEQINYLNEHRGEVVGVPTGYVDLDEVTGGLQRSDLIILAARPATGKTSLALCLAYNVAMRGNGTVGVFSLEMSRDQLVQRIIAMHTGIDTQRLRTGNIRDTDLQNVMEALGQLSSVPIYIEDSAGLSITDVRAKARRLHAEAGLDLLIIDYLQLMQGRSRDNRVQEVSEISRGLKALARELNVPLIALSQLSRAVEGRSTHVPMLSDLRESGCLAGESLVYLPDTGTYERIDRLVGKIGFNVLALNTETWQLEPRQVLNAFATGHKPVWKLTTRLGRSIRATANHKFLTVHGWQRLDKLAPGTRLALPRRLPVRDMSQSSFSPTSGEGSQSIGTPLRPLSPNGRGGWGVRGSARRSTVTWPCLPGLAEATMSDVELALYRAVPATQSVGITSRQMQAALGNAYCGTGLYKQNVSRERTERLAQVVRSDTLERLARSDVYWDEIVAIEPDGTADVYDLTVEGLHNFVANDTVVHNSIEQDADIVMFIYREELYDKETDKKGIAEIHIAKHRNGPTAVIPLRFDANTTSFQNLERYRSPEGY